MVKLGFPGDDRIQNSNSLAESGWRGSLDLMWQEFGFTSTNYWNESRDRVAITLILDLEEEFAGLIFQAPH